jgi:uncharacterized protein YlzI (FlbEa/FlbD family)
MTYFTDKANFIQVTDTNGVKHSVALAHITLITAGVGNSGEEYVIITTVNGEKVYVKESYAGFINNPFQGR